MKLLRCDSCHQYIVMNVVGVEECPHCQEVDKSASSIANNSNIVKNSKTALTSMMLLGLMGCGDKPDTGVMPLYGAEEIRDTGSDTGEDTGSDTGDDSAISVLYGVEQSDE